MINSVEYNSPRRSVRTGPEAHGANRLIRYMEARGWGFQKLHGGLYQQGLPDYFAMHPVHGLRWIEMKAPGKKLRPSQIQTFEFMNKFHQPVFVLHDEKEYCLLFDGLYKQFGNWRGHIL